MNKRTQVFFPKALVTADSFEELAERTVTTLAHEHGFHMVSGPISTGGLGSVSRNLDVLSAAITKLKRDGLKVFDQTPYEEVLQELSKKWKAEGNTGYCMPILEVFYDAIFKNRIVTHGWFIPGWQSSTGARWEHERILFYGGKIHVFSADEIAECVAGAYSKKKAEKLLLLIKSA